MHLVNAVSGKTRGKTNRASDILFQRIIGVGCHGDAHHLQVRHGSLDAGRMTFEQIRRITIIALFSDDVLMEQLVLKGGNAISLIHKLGSRSSLDLDFSMEKDFENLDETRERIFRALRDRFDSAGLVVFDESFKSKPKLDGPDERPWWGGYELRFKVIEKERYDQFRDHSKRQNAALTVGPGQERVFSVDLSKYEFTDGKMEAELDDYVIYVYTLEMVVAEKLRAICQQMPEYSLKGRPKPRARDFYDIHLVLKKTLIDLTTPGNCELLRSIFRAKQVPLRFLNKISEQREFHRADWPAVVASVGEKLEEYDFYFDFVLRLVETLEPLWIVEPPL
jgi:predicted nucleotidyltransferase component of viral defense system